MPHTLHWHAHAAKTTNLLHGCLLQTTGNATTTPTVKQTTQNAAGGYSSSKIQHVYLPKGSVSSFLLRTVKISQLLQQAQHITTTLNKAATQHFLGLNVMRAFLKLRNDVKITA